jgi:aryl-alcohol dehydrogenase-like predicted oxidoreductase
MIFGQALLTPENRETNHQVVDDLAALAGELGIKLPQLALAWVLHHEPVSVALVGARTAPEIQDAVVAANVQLDTATMARIDEIAARVAGRSLEVLT